MPRKLTVTARTIFSPPHKAQMVSEGELLISGKAPRHRGGGGGGGVTRKHDRRARTANSLCILDRQRRLPKTLRDHVRSASALSALKKSLVANLSAKRQLSVAKLSAKRIFSLAKRDFLVANGRMAADFSSPENAEQPRQSKNKCSSAWKGFEGGRRSSASHMHSVHFPMDKVGYTSESPRGKTSTACRWLAP